MSEFKILQQLYRDISILYVEDDPNLREQVSIFLKNLTDQLHTAVDGAEGLDMYQKVSPDLVITDIQMPRMTGVEMISEIHTIKPDAMVIVTTAFNEVELLTKLIDLGVDTYIKKPIEYKSFYATLTKLGKMIRAKKEIDEKNQMILQQARLAGMGEILSMVAHHWRQPLNVLALSIQEVQMLKDDGELDDAFIDEFVHRSTDVIQSMSKTIDTFQGFTKQQNNDSNFDLTDTLNNTLTLIEPILNENKIGYEIKADESLQVFNDRYSFQQVLYNVIINSVEAITDKGRSDGKIMLSSRFDGSGNLAITIEDNGGGVTVDPIERIYEPYYSTKGPKSGKGIGLYVTRMIVEKNLCGTIASQKGENGLITAINIPVEKTGMVV